VIAVNKVTRRRRKPMRGVSPHRRAIFPIAANTAPRDDLLDEALKQTKSLLPSRRKTPGVIEVAIIGGPTSEVHVAESHGRRRALHRFADSRHHDGQRGSGNHARRSQLPLRDTRESAAREKPPVAEKLSVVMAPRPGTLRRRLLVVDGEQGVTQGDAQIALREESGRSWYRHQ